MLNLLFVGRGLVCGHDQAWENQTNHRSKNQPLPLKMKCLHGIAPLLNCGDKCTREPCSFGSCFAPKRTVRARAGTRRSSAIVVAPGPELEFCEPLGD